MNYFSPTFVGFFVCDIVVRLNEKKTGELIMKLSNSIRIQPYTMAWDFIYYTGFTSHEKISFGNLNDFRFNEFQFFHSEPKSTHPPTNKKPRVTGA